MNTAKISTRWMMLVIAGSALTVGCSVTKPAGKANADLLLKDSAISTGHIGICIYEPATRKYWYQYDDEKYFVPASNTKLFTLYAGMKYLGDSLTGLQYSLQKDTVFALPAGDPSFLHPDFKNQPVIEKLQSLKMPVKFINSPFDAEKFGAGWAWDDATDDYMVERNALPVYGNLMKVGLSNTRILNAAQTADSITYRTISLISPPKGLWLSHNFKIDDKYGSPQITRHANDNDIEVAFADKNFDVQKQFPIVTNGIKTALQILHANYSWIQAEAGDYAFPPASFQTIRSQPVDSLFKPMMHRSDNFFAEQTLLMVSRQRLGTMNDKLIIDTLLKSDLKDLPQKPKWVDGCGLSRYNLATPQSFVYILNKMKDEFGWERMKEILPTGGEGTLRSYFKKDSGYIYAKTGTLSNHCALSGYLITRKGKLLIFSILANHYQTGATPIRQATERFLEALREEN